MAFIIFFEFFFSVKESRYRELTSLIYKGMNFFNIKFIEDG